MKELMDLLKKKASEKESHMGEDESKAYMDVLQELRGMMDSEMSRDLKPQYDEKAPHPKMIARVSAESPEELQEGLAKASEVADQLGEGADEEEDRLEAVNQDSEDAEASRENRRNKKMNS